MVAHRGRLAFVTVDQPVNQTTRELTDEDVDAAWAVTKQAFDLGDDRQERFGDTFRPERSLGVFEDGRLVGKLTTHALGHWIGGRAVPMGGIAGVTVTPDRRAAGVTSGLLRAELRRMRERGEVTSSLFPATVAPYRRSGWEVAGHRIRRRVPLRSLAGLPRPDGVTVSPIDLGDDAGSGLDDVRAVYDQVAPTAHGWLVRDDWWFSQRASSWRRNDRAHAYVARDASGAPTGYLVYHHTSGEDDEFYGLQIDELVAADGDATSALWRLVASNRGVSRYGTFHGGPEEPLFLLLAEQDTTVVEDWRWMTRLVDLAGAVEARGWPAGASAEVHLEVHDDAAPWNAGRWVLRVSEGRGVLEEGGRGTVRTTIGALAPLYSGMATARTLARVGLLEGAGAADLGALHEAFGGPAPWMLEFF